MREVLFRGKCEDNGEWIEGYYCGKVNKTIFSPAEDSAQIIDDDLYWHEVIPKTVGQYTGLTDKKGKKIFEGDVVKYKTVCRFDYDDDLEKFGNKNPELTNSYIGVIDWNEKGGCFFPFPNRNDCEDFWYSFGTYDFEVIGNIHDNPELLKGGAE